MPSAQPEIFVSTPFQGSSDPRITDAFLIRLEVFAEEQHCDPDVDRDEADETSFHWVAYARSPTPDTRPTSTYATANNLIPIATARLVLPPFGPNPVSGGPSIHAPKGYLKIGRMAVRKPWRKMGVAKMIVDALCEFAGREMGRDVWDGRMLAQAQVQAKKAWRRMGFLEGKEWEGKEGGEGCIDMGEWSEENIMHIAAWRRIEVLNEVTERGKKEVTEDGVHGEGYSG